MSIFDTDLDTIDTDIFKLKYNASAATAYKGYSMVKMRIKERGCYVSHYYKRYFIVYSIKENKIYIITVIGNNVQEQEMKFNNLSAFDIDCIIQQYANKLLSEAKSQDTYWANGEVPTFYEFNVEFY